MSYNQELADRVRQKMRRRRGLEEKAMFGGLGFLLHGNMCVGIWKDSLVVRFDRQDHDEMLAQPHVRPFDITGKVMKGWLLVEDTGLETELDLQEWIELAVNHVRTLPVKK